MNLTLFRAEVAVGLMGLDRPRLAFNHHTMKTVLAVKRFLDLPLQPAGPRQPHPPHRETAPPRDGEIEGSRHPPCAVAGRHTECAGYFHPFSRWSRTRLGAILAARRCTSILVPVQLAVELALPPSH